MHIIFIFFLPAYSWNLVGENFQLCASRLLPIFPFDKLTHVTLFEMGK